MPFTKDSYYQEKFSRLSLTEETIHNKEFEDCQFDNCMISAVHPVRSIVSTE